MQGDDGYGYPTMTMRRHEGTACKKGYYHEPPCDPPDPHDGNPTMNAPRAIETKERVSEMRRNGDCLCPICVCGRAVQSIEDATNHWVEREGEQDMAFYWLRDEVARCLASPWWRRIRPRLREALRTSKVETHNYGREAV